MPRLSHSEAVLSEAMREMKKSWDSTSSAWRDQARETFGKEYVDEVLRAVRASVGAASKINQLLGQAIRECS